MTDPSQLHPISCRRCRQKKIRCNRLLPLCSNCSETDHLCIYQDRVKKKIKVAATKNALQSSTSNSSPPLSVTDQLKRIEDQLSSFPKANQPGDEGHLPQTLVPGLSTISNQVITFWPLYSAEVNKYVHQGHAFVIPHRSFPVAPATPDAATREQVTLATTFWMTNNYNAVKMAVDQVRELFLQRFTSPSAIAQEITIPKEYAKSWIAAAQLHLVHGDLFTNLIDIELIKLLPDIVGHPHVRVDSAMLLIYYSILYYGSSLPCREARLTLGWSSKLYLCALRVLPGWQREATGSEADFMAAICMMGIAVENFDAELAWRLYRQACEYAQALKLHQVDGPDSPGAPVLDRARKSFWELVQVDLYFRLILDKPPTLTANMHTWNVNLPRLTNGVEADEDAVPAIHFLVSSRLTFAITEFFHLMDDASVGGETGGLFDKVEGLCLELEELYAEWNLEDWARKASHDDMRLSMLADAALVGYASIVSMVRRVTARMYNFENLEIADTAVARMPLMLRVSRRMLLTAHLLLMVDPQLNVLSLLVDASNLVLAYLYVARSLLDSPGGPPCPEDVKLLDDIAQDIEAISRDEKEVVPLARAIRRLNAEVQEKVNGCLQSIHNSTAA